MSKSGAAAMPADESPRLYADAPRLAAHGGVQLQQLKALPVEVARKPDAVGMPPLVWAARAGDLATVKYLVEEAGCSDVNAAIGWGGLTPLMVASVGAHETVVTELLHKGADVHAIDDVGNTTLTYATKGGSVSLVNSLIEAGGEKLVSRLNSVGRTALFVAITNGQQAIVAALLKAGARLDVVDARGNNVLHLAASAGFPRIIEALLQHLNQNKDCSALPLEALLAAKNDEGFTPADAASTSASKSALTGRPASAAAR